MGMFDYIRCEVPLPDGFQGELQTKDLDCELLEHQITKDGRVLVAREGFGEHANVKYEDAEYHGFLSFYGLEYLKENGEPFRDGGGVMHTGAETVSQKTGERLKLVWHEYRAKFTEGQLVEIVQIKDEAS